MWTQIHHIAFAESLRNHLRNLAKESFFLFRKLAAQVTLPKLSLKSGRGTRTVPFNCGHSKPLPFDFESKSFQIHTFAIAPQDPPHWFEGLILVLLFFALLAGFGLPSADFEQGLSASPLAFKTYNPHHLPVHHLRRNSCKKLEPSSSMSGLSTALSLSTHPWCHMTSFHKPSCWTASIWATYFYRNVLVLFQTIQRCLCSPTQAS